MTIDQAAIASRDIRRCPLDGVYLEKTDAHIYCRFEQPRQVLSSAVLGAELDQACQFLNLRVDARATDYSKSPQQSLLDYCAGQGWDQSFGHPAHRNAKLENSTVGMMTAASMNSLRYGVAEAEGVQLLIVLTCGLANARRAGDRADSRNSEMRANSSDRPLGTINIAVIANRRFSRAALVELLLMTTEAKCAALQNAAVKSPISGDTATGTGTDSVAVFNGPPIANSGASGETTAAEIQYCGKHTLLGEVFANKLMALLSDSFAEDRLLNATT